jgi:hypothetical protein
MQRESLLDITTDFEVQKGMGEGVHNRGPYTTTA